MKRLILLLAAVLGAESLIQACTPPTMQKNAVSNISSGERNVQAEDIMQLKSTLSEGEKNDLKGRFLALMGAMQLRVQYDDIPNSDYVRINLLFHNVFRAARRYMAFFKERGYTLEAIEKFDIESLQEKGAFKKQVQSFKKSNWYEPKTFFAKIFEVSYAFLRAYNAKSTPHEFKKTLYSECTEYEPTDSQGKSDLMLINAVAQGLSDESAAHKIHEEYALFRTRFIQIMRTIADGSFWTAPEHVIVDAYWKLRNRYTQDSKRAELLQEAQFNRLWYELYELSDHVRQDVKSINYIKQLCHAPMIKVDFKKGFIESPETGIKK